jgi:hypothetical protein
MARASSVKRGETLGDPRPQWIREEHAPEDPSRGSIRPDGGSLHVRAPITPILELASVWNPELDAIDNIMLMAR